MERHEQDRVVARDDVLGAVAVVHVPVDDRDALQAELRLGPARGDRHVVEQAEAHRPLALGVVARRPREGEPAAADGFDRRAGREQRGLVGVSVHIVSASIQPRVSRTSPASSGVWHRSTSSSVAGAHSAKGNRSCSTTIRC